MSLTSGDRVGPYEIVSLRGAGGMGQVYRARDTRLDRTVAVKVLPPGLEGNEELRARFELEARAISSLSHPNICALYDVGRDGGTEYLVMEYLEGETLAEKLARGPLPQSLVVRYGAQIAAALQHAHRAGITHRDLKPGNVMITAEGVKLMDFGLAKFIEKVPRPHSDDSAPSTALFPITAEGKIVGTAHYMSPEQVEGKPVDHRTDIFSLGVVLYEMATGRRPFSADSAASLFAAILSRDPAPVRSLQPSVTAELERVVLTALEKNPDERWQTAQDVGRQLQFLGDGSPESRVATAAPPPVPARRSTARIATLLAVAMLAGGLMVWSALRRFAPTPRAGIDSVKLQFALPPELTSVRSRELVEFAISPDGRKVAFIARREGPPAIFVRSLDAFEVTELPGTEGAMGPFWSSDGRWIGFSARQTLWKVRVEGAMPPVAICKISVGGARASWRGDTILFSDIRSSQAGILRVPDSGGTPVELTSVKPDEWRHSWPCLLPDGNHFIYERFASGTSDRNLVLASLDSSRESVLATNVSLARVSGSDRLVFVRDGTLLAQTLDLKHGVLTGEPETIGSDVAYFHMTGEASFDASPAGVIVFRKDTSSGRLVLFDRSGREAKEVDSGLFWDQELSPDGRKAAVTVVAPDTGLMDIWIYDLARGVRDRFTSEPAIEVSPAWSPDGRSIVYSQGEGGVFPHLVRRALGSSSSEDVTPRGPFQFDATIAPDGRTGYYESTEGGGSDIYRADLETRTATPFLKSSFAEGEPSISHDGRFLAYVSNASGANEIYVVSLDTPEATPVRVSAGGGIAARWRGDDGELVYSNSDGSVISARPKKPGHWDDVVLEELFRVPEPIQAFDVASDGQSFLISTWRKGPQDDIFAVVIGDRPRAHGGGSGGTSR